MFCQKCGEKLIEGGTFCTHCGHSNLTEFHPVSMGRRFGNYILDTLGIYLFSIILGILAGIAGLADYTVTTVTSVILVLLGVFGYFIISESLWQRTPGKWLTKTKVVREDGGKPRFWQIVGRTLCRYIPFEALSFFSGSYPIGWHDRFSGTLVVPRSYTVEDVQKINLAQLKKAKSSTIVIIVVCILGGIMVIGILASLNAAREKAQDAAIRETLSSIGAQAEVVYEKDSVDKTKGYYGVCSDPAVANMIGGMLGVDPNAVGCISNTDGYTVVAPLKSGTYLCIDKQRTLVELKERGEERTTCAE